MNTICWITNWVIEYITCLHRTHEIIIPKFIFYVFTCSLVCGWKCAWDFRIWQMCTWIYCFAFRKYLSCEFAECVRFKFRRQQKKLSAHRRIRKIYVRIFGWQNYRIIWMSLSHDDTIKIWHLVVLHAFEKISVQRMWALGTTKAICNLDIHQSIFQWVDFA